MSEEARADIAVTLEKATEVVTAMQAIIADLQPKAEFGLMAMGDDTAYSMKEAADLLQIKTGMGRNQLMEWMRDEGILLSTTNYWNQPAREYIKTGYFKKIEKATSVGMKMVPVVTNKGIEFILRRWNAIAS